MPKKENAAGEMQNYDPATGRYEGGTSGGGESKKEEKKLSSFKKEPSEFNKANAKRMGKKSKVEDWQISEALDDFKWQVTQETTVGQYAQETADRLGIDKEDVLAIMKKENGELNENDKLAPILFGEDMDDDEPESEFKPVPAPPNKAFERYKKLEPFRKYLRENKGEFERLSNILAKEKYGEDEWDIERPINTEELYKIKQREDAEKAKKAQEPFKLDKKKYPDVETTPYGFIYNVDGISIEDIGEHMKKSGMGVGKNDNAGFSVAIDGEELWYASFDEAYQAIKKMKK